MYEIEIANQQTLLPVDQALLKRFAGETLAAEEVAHAELSIAIVDDAEIWRVNREFLQHDYATDVISFVYESDFSIRGELRTRDPARAMPRGALASIVGEVIVSAEFAIKTATEYEWSAQDELVLYLVHGILHLCGYDDLSEVEQHAMRAREAEILGLWNLSPRYHEIHR